MTTVHSQSLLKILKRSSINSIAEFLLKTHAQWPVSTMKDLAVAAAEEETVEVAVVDAEDADFSIQFPGV